jgi:thioredoxin 1
MLLDPNHFETDVLGAGESVLVDFYGTYCPPCRALMPTIDKLAQDGYAIVKVNVQDHPELATQFGVKAVPTLVVLRGGQEVSRFVGLQSERVLRDALDRARALAS